MIWTKEYVDDLKTASKIGLPWERFKNKRILITGATGLIGSCLADLLIVVNNIYDLSMKVYLMSRNKNKIKERFRHFDEDEYVVLEQDIRTQIAEELVFDYIVNTASNAHPIAYAKDPVGTLTGNILGLYNILEKAVMCGAECVIELSSSEVYGMKSNDDYVFLENEYGVVDCNRVRASYPEGKRACEALCQGYIDQYGLKVMILRPGRIYGPTMTLEDTKATAQFIRSAVNNKDIILKSDGEQMFSFGYMLDVATAILYLIFKGKNGEAYNVSDKNSVLKLKELASIAAQISGCKVRFDIPNINEAKGFSNTPGMVLDCTKLEALGWKAKTNIKEGLMKTMTILSKEGY